MRWSTNWTFDGSALSLPVLGPGGTRGAGWLHGDQIQSFAPPLAPMTNTLSRRSTADFLGRVWRAAERLALLSFPRKETVPYDWFNHSEVDCLQRHLCSPGQRSVDDQTWADLALDDYLRSTLQDSSILGRQAAYRRLKSCAAYDVAALRDGTNPASTADLTQLTKTLDGLKYSRFDLGNAVFHAKDLTLPAWARWAWLLSILALAGLMALSAIGLTTGILLLSIYGALAVFCSLRLSGLHRHWTQLRSASVHLLKTAQDVSDLGRRGSLMLCKPLAEQRRQIGEMLVAIQASPLESIPLLVQYLNLFFFYEYAGLGRRIARFQHHLASLQQVYIALADIELGCRLAHHLRTRVDVCWANPVAIGTLRFSGLRNPLLAGCDAFEVEAAAKGIFLTGKNGSGKSTLLRAIGINVLTARVLGFAYAQEAAVPPLYVISSIVNEDSLARSESLYMAELRRMREIVAFCADSNDSLVIADELFRGTNPLESVAVAAAMVRHIARNALVLLSSHQVILSSLLGDCLSPCFLATTTRGRSLRPGVLPDTNGVEMLFRYDFPPSITEAAAAHARHLVACFLDPSLARASPTG